jgi:hypothetical protein
MEETTIVRGLFHVAGRIAPSVALVGECYVASVGAGLAVDAKRGTEK